jgi:hypothetical protein
MPPNERPNSCFSVTVSRDPILMRSNPDCVLLKGFNRRAAMLKKFTGLSVSTSRYYKLPFEPASPASNFSWSGPLSELLASNRGEILPRLDKNTVFFMAQVARLSNQKAQENAKDMHPTPWNPSTRLELKKTKSRVEDDVSEISNSDLDSISSIPPLTPEQLRNENRRVIREGQGRPGFFRESHVLSHQCCKSIHENRWRT